MGRKTKRVNLFLRYHSITNTFAEHIWKKLYERFNIHPSEFRTLACAYIMVYKKGFFFRKFISDVIGIDDSVASKAVKKIQQKGFVEQDGKVGRFKKMLLTNRGRNVINSYTQIYAEIVNNFEKEFWEIKEY